MVYAHLFLHTKKYVIILINSLFIFIPNKPTKKTNDLKETFILINIKLLIT